LIYSAPGLQTLLLLVLAFCVGFSTPGCRSPLTGSSAAGRPSRRRAAAAPSAGGCAASGSRSEHPPGPERESTDPAARLRKKPCT